MLLSRCLFLLGGATIAVASALNETCLSSRDCSRESYCDLATSTCSDLSQLGMACAADCHCASGGVCYGGVCKECAANSDCNRGYDRYERRYCDLSTWKCEYQAKNGEACSKSEMCDSGHCYEGKCKDGSSGEPCVTAADCEGHEVYFCSPSSSTCIRGHRPVGEHCELDKQCLSGLCSESSCKRPDGSWGTTCLKNSDCKSPLVCGRDVEGGKSCLHPGQQWEDQSASKCTAPGQFCTSDSACCSKNCKWTEILGLRECA